MNAAVYDAARRAGCTPGEAEILAVYVESEKVSAAAAALGISEQTAKNRLNAVRRRFKVRHTAAVIARLRS